MSVVKHCPDVADGYTVDEVSQDLQAHPLWSSLAELEHRTLSKRESAVLIQSLVFQVVGPLLRISVAGHLELGLEATTPEGV